jgi:hypothetical protein
MLNFPRVHVKGATSDPCHPFPLSTFSVQTSWPAAASVGDQRLPPQRFAQAPSYSLAHCNTPAESMSATWLPSATSTAGAVSIDKAVPWSAQTTPIVAADARNKSIQSKDLNTFSSSDRSIARTRSLVPFIPASARFPTPHRHTYIKACTVDTN